MDPGVRHLIPLSCFEAEPTTGVLVHPTHPIVMPSRFTTLLACRFILDLHEASEAQFGRGSQHSPTFAFSSIEFQSRNRAPDRLPEDARSVFGAMLTWDTRRAAYILSDHIELDGTTYVASSVSQDTEHAVDRVQLHGHLTKQVLQFLFTVAMHLAKQRHKLETPACPRPSHLFQTTGFG